MTAHVRKRLSASILQGLQELTVLAMASTPDDIFGEDIENNPDLERRWKNVQAAAEWVENEILSRTPAGKREADKLREVLRD